MTGLFCWMGVSEGKEWVEDSCAKARSSYISCLLPKQMLILLLLLVFGCYYHASSGSYGFRKHGVAVLSIIKFPSGSKSYLIRGIGFELEISCSTNQQRFEHDRV